MVVLGICGLGRAGGETDCQDCHDDADLESGSGRKVGVDAAALAAGVHADLDCVDCHAQAGDYDDTPHFEAYEPVDCSTCHEEAQDAYAKSAHQLARLRDQRVAATCGACHGHHGIRSAEDSESPTNRQHIPETCGKCHNGQQNITEDFVRLPISLPRYNESIHGAGWKQGKPTAVCTSCHNHHEIIGAVSSESPTHKTKLAHTCGQCHEKVAAEFINSAHGRALAHGIMDSPSCTDCHDEHLILARGDPRSTVHPDHLAAETCARCHEDPEMAARFGLLPHVVESYADTYHGWALKRGGDTAAGCIDCHRTHAIGSVLDPSSSIHPNNVVATCSQCHAGSNPTFATSYSHIEARDRRLLHDWIQYFYLWLIGITLGGMVLHNLLLFLADLRRSYQRHQRAASAERMTRWERWQHGLLIVTFFGLAVSGFALRFPDAWWAKTLTEVGFNEELRRLVHRVFAVLLVGAAMVQLYWFFFTVLGRERLVQLLPRKRDVSDLFANILFHLGRRPTSPKFGFFDYTQKAEFWALVWGTVLMGITGVVLWFPDLVTQWLPSWSVRVSEVIHFFEAILAVSAIVIWHFHFVLMMPGVYPMSWTWITGKADHGESSNQQHPPN
ncbi:MAG: hypothetical protein A2289_14475 [Deltaproteobacteria bacterium RIFOXYA12_FULL_58_15]|nr:MAG: hypothetical protein A2289_14475 [Deltaproteobacteria bacterium RIFOXYA12_FULL_58_15]